MIVGGIVTALLFDRLLVVGISVSIAGVIGLVTLANFWLRRRWVHE